MKFEKTEVDGVFVLSVCGARIDSQTSATLRKQLAEVVAGGHHIILADLSQVQFIDSTGLGALVSGLKLVGRDGTFALCGTAEAVQSLLELTRMDRIFRMFPTQAAGLAELAETA